MNICILGSTGSIGTQTLEVIEEHPDFFKTEILTARSNYQLLIQQALKHKPNAVVIENEAHYHKVKEALENTDTKVFAGSQAQLDILDFSSIDTVVIAVVGAAGLQPTLKAIENKKRIALANKESLVVGGSLVMQAANENRVPIFPIDSEHSAIFQCLLGEGAGASEHSPIEKILLTGSGGPFRGKSLHTLKNITPEEALKHPTWSMGKKITIDSATLMNKGLELIEACHLFNLPQDKIEVVIHPQSIVHSLVMFEDSSVKAQLGYPSMKVPIQLALSFPQRLSSNEKRLDLAQIATLTFENPDTDTFRCLALAREAIKQGGNMPCILNAANEIAVDDFLNGKKSFLQIAKTVERCMCDVAFIAKPSLTALLETDMLTRIYAAEKK